ncbi:glycosyl hydrolase family 18 protein [Motilimonas sp. KMU-193]|uniref:glycosyl hydrolase family 18 protein n=1 Tax=Motilimonas sp. KMU-193 TaxID=3388668 RepID=UPI00396B1156
MNNHPCFKRTKINLATGLAIASALTAVILPTSVMAEAEIIHEFEIDQVTSSSIEIGAFPIGSEYRPSHYFSERVHTGLVLKDATSPGVAPNEYQTMRLQPHQTLHSYGFTPLGQLSDADKNWHATQDQNQPFDVLKSGKVVALYVGSWQAFNGYSLEQIPARNITHLIFGFAGICDYQREDATQNQGLAMNPGAFNALRADCGVGEVQGKDGQDYNLVELGVTEQKADFALAFPDYKAAPHAFAAIKQMKQAYPHLKAMLSIGAWTMSDPFFAIAAVPDYREQFAEQLVAFIKQHPGVFDGIDLDWEHPGGENSNPGLTRGHVADRAHFTALVKTLRQRFDHEFGPDFVLSAAISRFPRHIGAVDLAALKDDLSFVNLMTYDVFSTDYPFPGYHTGNAIKPIFSAAPVYQYLPVADELGNPVLINGQAKTMGDMFSAYSTEGAIQTVQTLYPDFPMSRLNIGVASYSRGWHAVKMKREHAPAFWHGTAQMLVDEQMQQRGFAVSGTFDAGTSSFIDIYDNYMQGDNNALYYDEQAKSVYVFVPQESDDQEHIYARVENIDSPRTVINKGELVKKYGLGGLFAWEATFDNGLILNAMNAAVCNPKADGQAYQFSETYAGSVDSQVLASDGSGRPTKVKEVIKGPSEYQFDGEAWCQGVNYPPQLSLQKAYQVNTPSLLSLAVSADDAEGDRLSYHWQQLSGPQVTLLNANQAQAQVIVPAVKTNQMADFAITVSDSQSQQTQYVRVTLSPTECAALTASAAPWQTHLAYRQGQQISFNQQLWQARWWNQASQPGHGEAWQLIAPAVAPWSAHQAYAQGEAVNHNGLSYVAKWWNQGVQPSLDPAWQAAGPAVCVD